MLQKLIEVKCFMEKKLWFLQNSTYSKMSIIVCERNHDIRDVN